MPDTIFSFLVLITHLCSSSLLIDHCNLGLCWDHTDKIIILIGATMLIQKQPFCMTENELIRGRSLPLLSL
jgi:hypothetical protein